MFYTLSRAIKDEKKNEKGVRQLEVKKGGRAKMGRNEKGELSRVKGEKRSKIFFFCVLFW